MSDAGGRLAVDTAVAVVDKSDQAVAVISVVVVAVTVLVVSGEVWADTVVVAAAAVDSQHTGPTSLADYTEPLAQRNWVLVREWSWGLLG